MRVKIVDTPVRENVEIFLGLLRRAKQKLPQETTPSEKIFSAWLNRESGQLVFTEVESESLATDDWKPVEISYRFDPQTEEIHFLMEERESPIQGFCWEDLAPAAYSIFRETMSVLNNMCRQLKGPSDLDTKISVLTKVIIESSPSHPERNLIIETWHAVDRFGAEALLMDKPIGSYLFRRDPFCEILEQQLQGMHQMAIKCFTLSYSQPNKKFSDFTIVHCNGKWQCYNDDPSLQQPSFDHLTELLAQWKELLRYPLIKL